MTERSKCLVLPADYARHWLDKPAPDEQPAPETPRHAPFAGWTFGEFLDACRRLGLRDHDRLSSIEFGVMANGGRCLSVEQGDDGFEVRERFR